MTGWAVHNIYTPAIEVDDDRSYCVAPDGPLYHVVPLTRDDGLAIFDTFDEAEEWRQQRLAG